LQNITGNIFSRPHSSAGIVGALANGTGAFGNTVTNSGNPGTAPVTTAASALVSDSTIFDASRVARTSTETRPRNLAVIWGIKAWNAPINQGNIDIAALQSLAAQATEINRGTAKIATQALTDAGADDSSIVTPKKLRWKVSFLIAPNGYLAFPSWLGGLIVQWASTQITTNGANGGIGTVTLPMAFPNASFGVLAIKRNTAFLNGAETFQAAPSGLTQAVISIDSASGNEGSGTRDVFYIALGN